MVCVNCGKKLIRGYSFCLDCGSPVPPEVLEEGGMPGRTDNEGRPPKPETETETESAPKKEDEPEKPVSEVQSSMPGVEPLDGGNSTETLVFCPNCGMHMQGNSYQCNKCGMYLGDKPKNIPLSAGGVPLMNPDEMAIGGGLDLGLGDVSDSEIEQISSFMSGSGVIPIFAAEDNSNPDLFGNDISANDFAALSEQLANFSAANEMPSIEAVEPKKTASKSSDRRVDNFSMSDDGTGTVPPVGNTVPVIENYSMDENPNENINLDPYKFLNNSMDDTPAEIPAAKPAEPEFEPLFSKSPSPPEPVKQEPEPTPKPEPERLEFEPIFASSAPAPIAVEKPEEQPPEPPRPAEPPVPEKIEEAPVITETAPVINEFVPPPVQAAPKPQETDIFSQPVPPRPAQQTAVPVQEAPRGNMFRCQLCGHSMYDTDKFCPNCGASYKNGSVAVPRNKSKTTLIIGIAIVLIVLAAVGFFVMNSLNGGGESIPSPVVSGSVPESDESTESTDSSESADASGSSSTSTEEGSSSTSTSTSAPNSSTSSAGGSSSSTGAPPSSTGSTSSTGAPASTTGTPSSSSRPSSSSTGAPISSTGTPPSSTNRAPTSSTGAPHALS
ncbi:MAG: hypothetical protein HDR72_02335 [Ruminococcaceae bacterium]|nr:hypothetical protein [Oscillospiraceae bacterium]